MAPTIVVPAKAGTHNPWRSRLQKLRCNVVFESKVLGVWVPAFAGTTQVGSNFQTTADIPSRSRRPFRARFAMNVRSLKSEGAGNAGRPLRPQPRVQNKKAHEHSHHGHTGFTRHSPRNGFNGFLRALPGDRACLPPSSAVARQQATGLQGGLGRVLINRA